MLLLITHKKRKKMMIMAYYFAVETKENNYNAINIKRSRTYSHQAYTYDNPFACTLKEIDEITSTFKNEEELRLALINCYSLNSQNFDKSFRIFYKEGIESRIVSKSIIYEDSREYIEEPTEIIKYIENKSQQNDYNFFRQLADTLSDESITKSLISKIASLIEKSTITGERDEDLDKLNILGTNIVTETTKLLIYQNYINEQGNITYKNKINYEKLHNLVVFISNYKLTLNKDKKSNLKRVKTKENTSN